MHRIAVIGAGGFARAHLGVLAHHPRLTAAYVVGTDLDHTRQAAMVAPGAVASTDLDEALANSDAVIVTNATDGHAPAAIAAANAGKPVLCEKPVCRTLGELDAIEAAVTKAQTTFLVGQTVRFQPVVAAMARDIDAGGIGAPRYAHILWHTGHVWPGGWRGWQFDVERSGGHPVHNGVHAFDAAIRLLGQTPTRVFCRPMPTWGQGMPVPDGFHATLRFGDQALALVELSYGLRRAGAFHRRWLVGGEEGSLSHDTLAEEEVWSNQGAVPPPSIDGALRAEHDHWADVLDGSAPPETTWAQIRAALATGLAAQRSLVSGQPEEVTL